MKFFAFFTAIFRFHGRRVRLANDAYSDFFATVDSRWRADAEARFRTCNMPASFTPKDAAAAAEQAWINDRRIEASNHLVLGAVQGGVQVLAPDGGPLPGGNPISPGRA